MTYALFNVFSGINVGGATPNPIGNSDSSNNGLSRILATDPTSMTNTLNGNV